MKPPELVKREFVAQWLEKARQDLDACQHLVSGGDAFVYGAAFHAQQSVEKHLKAVLVWRQVEFPKTHDIAQLLALVTLHDPELVDAVGQADELTPYGVEYRYPGDYPDVNLGDAKHALQIAEMVCDKVLAALPSEFRSAGSEMGE